MATSVATELCQWEDCDALSKRATGLGKSVFCPPHARQNWMRLIDESATKAQERREANGALFLTAMKAGKEALDDYTDVAGIDGKAEVIIRPAGASEARYAVENLGAGRRTGPDGKREVFLVFAIEGSFAKSQRFAMAYARHITENSDVKAKAKAFSE